MLRIDSAKISSVLTLCDDSLDLQWGRNMLRSVVTVVMLLLILPCISVQAHTPNVMMSILKDSGPEPMDVLETAGFVEGDGIKFKMSDNSNNATMRVSIDLDMDGKFNESSDYFSPWMVYDCLYDENGTLLDSECIESIVFYFNDSNGAGSYSYQVEKMVNESHTDFWVNSIFVGVDSHEEVGVPSIGDCFGSGCDEVANQALSESDDRKYISILMVISALGLIIIAISLVTEKPSEEVKKQYLEDE
ncbi:MAG: hypothetical protein VXY53_02645 [Candidatus Thermoplasmatota archaeon]|nr:hypothetical protein [Candidatus Thermoplasmatota archaeon]